MRFELARLKVRWLRGSSLASGEDFEGQPLPQVAGYVLPGRNRHDSIVILRPPQVILPIPFISELDEQY